MLHNVLDILQIITLSLAGLGIILAILALVMPMRKSNDRIMYFGLRLLVGSIIVTGIVFAIMFIC